MRKLIAASLLKLLIFMPLQAYGIPTISSITGTFQENGSVTLTGAGFGSKNPAAAVIVADFATDANPSSLGSNTSWNGIANMSWVSGSGYGGGGGMQGTAGNGNWTLRVNQTSYNSFNSVTYIFGREKVNFVVIAGDNINKVNVKTKRFWPSSGGVSNLYASSSHGRIYAEYIGVESGYWANNNTNTTSWVTKEWKMTASSALGVKNGTLAERFNGVQKHSGTIMTKSAAAPADWTDGRIFHQVTANQASWTPAWSSSNNVWADDFYMDRTWSRAMIGDQPIFDNCRKLAMIAPTSWADGSISGVIKFMHTGDFAPGSTAYAFVFNASDVVNTTGKLFTVGGAALPNNPPVISSVNVSTGSYLGLTVSTITCVDALSSVTVVVGTITATNVTRVSSTMVRFTIPAGPAGVTGLDLKLINDADSQFSILPSTMSYTSPAPTNQAPYDVVAGDDIALLLPAVASLSGLAADDALPAPPASLTYLWQKKSGPGAVTFSDATSLETFAEFSSSGTYTLSLTANDSLLSTESAEIQIVVLPAIIIPPIAVPGAAFPFKRR